MPDESMWIERAQSAESKIETMRQAHEAAANRIKEFKTNFGIRERHDGSIDIDFDKFAERLGPENALALRKIIDEKYAIRGAPGKKPKMRAV